MNYVFYTKNSITFKKLMDLNMRYSQHAEVVKILSRIEHGCKTFQGSVNLFYSTSRVYNSVCEIHFPYDELQIDFNSEDRSKKK